MSMMGGSNGTSFNIQGMRNVGEVVSVSQAAWDTVRIGTSILKMIGKLDWSAADKMAGRLGSASKSATNEVVKEVVPITSPTITEPGISIFLLLLHLALEAFSTVIIPNI